MKVFNVFQDGTRIARLVEYDDGYAQLHYTIENFPRNEFAKAQAFKQWLTRIGYKYDLIWREVVE